MEKKYTVTLTERQIRDLETYVLSKELNTTNQASAEFYSELFVVLSGARNNEGK